MRVLTKNNFQGSRPGGCGLFLSGMGCWKWAGIVGVGSSISGLPSSEGGWGFWRLVVVWKRKPGRVL